MRRPSQVLIWLGFVFSTSLWANPRVCVVSWLGNSAFDKLLNAGVQQLPSTQKNNLVLFTQRFGTVISYQTLRSCLEGDFDEVLLLAHTREDILGKPGILFPERVDAYLYFSDRFFQTLHPSPRVKVFTLAVCQGEVVIQQYDQMRAYLDQAGIALRLAPSSALITALINHFSARKIGGIVPMSSALKLIDEATRNSDALNSGATCYFYRDPASPGRVVCAQGRLRLEGSAEAFRRGRWAHLTPDPGHDVWWIKQRQRPKRQILRRQPDGSFVNRKLRLTIQP